MSPLLLEGDSAREHYGKSATLPDHKSISSGLYGHFAGFSWLRKICPRKPVPQLG